MTMDAAIAETIHHEALHGAVLFHLIGEEAVGAISRSPTKMHRGSVKLADLPLRGAVGQGAALNAADLAVALLAPLNDPAVRDKAGCVEDWEKAYVCAETAYLYRPEWERNQDAEEWADQWVNGLATERAKRVISETAVGRYRRALEAALYHASDLTADEVREILLKADADG